MIKDGRLSRALRLVSAAAVLLFFLYWSFFAAYMIGWAFRPPGWHRLTDGHAQRALIISVVLGLIGITAARTILRRPVLSAWLILALPIPTLAVLDQGIGVL